MGNILYSERYRVRGFGQKFYPKYELWENPSYGGYELRALYCIRSDGKDGQVTLWKILNVTLTMFLLENATTFCIHLICVCPFCVNNKYMIYFCSLYLRIIEVKGKLREAKANS